MHTGMDTNETAIYKHKKVKKITRLKTKIP